MTEQLNPFDDVNFSAGGGLWDGKTVTITSAVAAVERLVNGDGSPVLNDKGEQAAQNVLLITGLADDDETERRQGYTSGGLVPTNDGDGFVKTDGTPGTFHKNSKAAKFFSAIKAGGFDLNRLIIDGKPSLKGLVGARFTFVGVDRLDKNGLPKKNKKGYTMQDFFPVKFLGIVTGREVVSPSAAGNGVARKEAQAVVLALLAETGGKLTRAEMLRKVAGKVIGKPNGNAILAIISRDDFHTGAPWSWDGLQLTQTF